MSVRTNGWIVALLVLGGTTSGEVKVAVELVPGNPGPYVSGERATVDLRPHSQIAVDWTWMFDQVDLSNKDPAIALAPTLTFDFNSDGTSMATPHVTVVVALVQTSYPSNLSRQKAREQVIKSTRSVGVLVGNVVTGGVVNACGRLRPATTTDATMTRISCAVAATPATGNPEVTNVTRTVSLMIAT